MTDLTACYVLREAIFVERCISFLRGNWKGCAASGKPIVVEITTEGSQRSPAQNRAYWALLQSIEMNGWVDGKQFGRDAWHEFLRAKFLPKIEGPAGTYPVSTTSLSVREMNDYLHAVENFACETLGLEL